LNVKNIGKQKLKVRGILMGQ